ncbi:hypothetical protein WJ542_11300 [Paraburkholderia sp. B3]|uniref:hypothetical protein n=1 Tax=Paraburkholderia sp. B3 TaxID=3134791 RepID=UPI003981FB2C
MSIHRAIASKLFKAQMFRLVATDGANRVELDHNEFFIIPSATRNSDRDIVAFQGVFCRNDGFTANAFVLSFTKTARGVRCTPAQFACAGLVKSETRLLGLVSVLDFMIAAGCYLPPDSSDLNGHISYMTRAGRLSSRSSIIADYPEFRKRAAKMLDYDDSLVVLEAA